MNADFAVVIALQFAKKLKKSPFQLALELSKELPIECSFSTTITQEGYLNCLIKDDFYQLSLKAINNKQLLSNNQKNFSSVNIEFVSVNPTGYLHLGHLRNAAIGDTLARAYIFLGYQVTREYYINDRGNQIDELVKSVLFYYQQLRGNNPDFLEENLSYRGSSTRAAAIWLLENSTVQNDDYSTENVYIREKIIDFFIAKIKTDLSLCGVQFDN